MKRLFSLLMAVLFVLSFSVTAFAAEDTGSITITNATIDQEYALYKIFDASISGGVDSGFIYTIKSTNQFFDDMFGADGKTANPYFNYNSESGVVTKKETVADADVLNYLKSLIYDEKEITDANGNKVKTYVLKTGLTMAKPSVIATSKEVKFEGIEYGYYMVTSTLGTTVTVNSTDPDVVVIDKNQKPGDDFTKLVWDEDYVDPITNLTGRWVVNSSANIGDIVDFKVEFHATNYNGEKLIKHYTIGDNKGSALWVEFNSIQIEVDGVAIGKGWYHCTDDDPTLQLDTGDWTAAKNPAVWAATANEASWYLIHNGYDDFDIIIPWLNNHTFTENGEEFTLAYPAANPTSRYASSAKVVIKYNASVEPSANIDGVSNLYNTADLSWTDDAVVTPPSTPTTDLTVHALGITKTDASTNADLAGAIFEIFRDKDGTVPVYVIPTDVGGVYILDDLNTIVSGDNRETSREKYAAYLSAYLNGAVQKNEVTTQVNGKLVVLGLEAGTYYLREKEAPSGYNKLAAPIEVTIGSDTPTVEFTFNTDDDGKVVTEHATETHVYKKVVNVPVTNSKGAELPSTGGEGTVKMIAIGTVIAMAFAVLLITHKKMSIYQD